jgi:hypothetical protein
MKIYDAPAMSSSDGDRILGDTRSQLWAHAVIAGMMTTKQLAELFLGAVITPDALVASCRALAAELRRRIDGAEIIASRCWRWNSAPPDVANERAWLPNIEHFVERATAAKNYWRAIGGPAELEKRAATERERAAPTAGQPPRPIMIRVEPTPVNVVAKVSPPVVSVVMAPRTKTTSIVHDSLGRIAGATSIESDAATAQVAS